MLIRFVTENFLSFRDRTEFSLAAGKIRRHEKHVSELNGKRVLKGSFLFGANAAGKSNLVKAMKFAADIVQEGRGALDFSKKYFRIDEECRRKPGVFQFDFFSNGKFYSYGFAYRYQDGSIVDEWLYQIEDAAEICIFYRTASSEQQIPQVWTDLVFEGERFNIYKEDIVSPKMRKNLFLTDVVRRSPDDDPSFQAFRDTAEWFSHLTFIFPESRFAGILQLIQDTDKKTQLTTLLRHFDTGIDDVIRTDVDFERIFADSVSGNSENLQQEFQNRLIEQMGNNSESRLFFYGEGDSLVEIRMEDGTLLASRVNTVHGNQADPFDFSDESDGTKRLFDLLPMYQAALEKNILIIDELDRSLHTQATRELVRYFYEVTEGVSAQLIATTQDSGLMDLDLLRQDEIWFVERGEDRASALYSLNKFKERFDKKVRNEYLLGRYGAIPCFNQTEIQDPDLV